MCVEWMHDNLQLCEPQQDVAAIYVRWKDTGVIVYLHKIPDCTLTKKQERLQKFQIVNLLMLQD